MAYLLQLVNDVDALPNKDHDLFRLSYPLSLSCTHYGIQNITSHALAMFSWALDYSTSQNVLVFKDIGSQVYCSVLLCWNSCDACLMI